MSEYQNIEYKQSWRDEYLKWTCDRFISVVESRGQTIVIDKEAYY